MKLIRIGGLALLAAVVGLGAWAATKAWAAHCGGGTGVSCTESVKDTKHNLAANTDLVGTGTVIGTSEVCVFCHTPHGGRDDVAGGGAPEWNRALPASTGFTNYTSPNFDNDQGAESPGPKGVSLACLSCHDGAIALDALINAPGSGGFDASNRSGISPRSSAGITFTGAGATADSLKEGERPSTDAGGGFLGGLNDFVNPGTGAGMEPFPNLGRNLTDDHPISMRMPSADLQFAEALDGLIASAGGNVNYVQRVGTQLPTDPRDRIRLYNSDATTVDWVECASCHNPHTPRTTFLRLPSLPGVGAVGTERPAYPAATGRDLNHEPNQGSLICFTCHEK
jgi:hypothetical protein